MTTKNGVSLGLRRLDAARRSSLGLLALCLAPALSACSSEAAGTQTGVTTGALEGANCGYSVSSHVSRTSKRGFFALVKITSASGGRLDSTGFTVLVNSGAAKLVRVFHGSAQEVENGYLLRTVGSPESEDPEVQEFGGDPDVLAGRAYRFLLRFEGAYSQLTTNILASSGTKCDQTAPAIKLSANREFFTSEGSLTLSAQATDNVAVAKVVFTRDGQEIGTVRTAPYTLQVPVTGALNGRHRYGATAYDLTGNQASETKRVLVAIDNKFFGTATSSAADYTNLLAHFDQITPGNAGKWGSVEATRDQMNWTELDTAYEFAKANNLPFKLHTLIWGQQQPAWLTGLSQAEQLEEIEEWMAALAERYGDIELIDVVNEPLHAVPSYAAALGGSGTTGWDWVVRSFEMARAYFPNSELLLNDYSIFTMTSTTEDYLKIVKVLSDRGLIDGIAEQGHFYERAPELSVLKANLDALSATGLPLYISELDVAFADDARQAIRMRDLFSTFWSNPSVLGVTHWGYREGGMWRENAHLLRADGSPRPALTWIECTRAGGANCTVPVYVPVPRTGDTGGITIEAEEYDSAFGLLPAGDVVAYASDGAWVGFDQVVFDDNWDELSVTYALGATSAVELSIHLDSLDNAPVATVSLAPTGGWGTTQTTSIPWASLSGSKNVFVRFSGGGANVDKLQFKGPQTSTNLVGNGTFESGTSGWYTWGGATLASSTARAHGGTASLLVSGRTGNSPAATDLTSVVQPGKSYPFSLWASIQSPDGTSQSINVTQATSCQAADGTITTEYKWIAGPSTLAGDTGWSWVQFSGTLAVPNCTLTQLQLFVEGGAGSDLFVDDVEVLDTSGASANLIPDGTFESGQGAWGGWGYTTLSASASRAHSGSRSLLGTGMQSGALARDIKSMVSPGKRYQASVWVSVDQLASGSGQVRLQTVQRCDGASGDSYPWLMGDTVNNGAWKQLTGTVDLTACNSVDNLLLYVGADAGDLYVDDVSLTPLP